jgi:hypothetical protein
MIKYPELSRIIPYPDRLCSNEKCSDLKLPRGSYQDNFGRTRVQKKALKNSKFETTRANILYFLHLKVDTKGAIKRPSQDASEIY